MLADYHVHTAFSDDSVCPIEEMVQKGLAIGLEEIAFTEHVDYGVKTDLNCDYPAYFAALRAMRAKYGSRIRLKKGIEFGVQAHTTARFRQDFDTCDFDFVILSNHQVDDKEFWTGDFQRGRSQEEFQQAYYRATYDVMRQYKCYSVLGHLDMIKRYDNYGEYPDEKIRDIAGKIFSQAIKDGKGIEVNTSCFKYGLPDLTPSRALLQLYHRLGGQVLTIGSDTHDAAHLGDHIPEARQMLKKIGFTRFCTFEAMQPVYHQL